MSDFVHLHVHTHYSLLDGACTPAGLLELAKEQDMCAVAMTDHGFMGGTIDMYHTFNKSGVKPIIGCEVYTYRLPPVLIVIPTIKIYAVFIWCCLRRTCRGIIPFANC